MKTQIKFTFYRTEFDDGPQVLLLFYPDDVWDEDKLTFLEALSKYPGEKFEWVYMSNKDSSAESFQSPF